MEVVEWEVFKVDETPGSSNADIVDPSLELLEQKNALWTLGDRYSIMHIKQFSL